MADLLTEEQGDQIISLLETISGYLFDIKMSVEASDKTLDSVKSSLRDIEVNTRN